MHLVHSTPEEAAAALAAGLRTKTASLPGNDFLSRIGGQLQSLSPQTRNALLSTGVGAGAGLGLGALAHFASPERKRRSLWQALLTGGLAGAGVGGGAALIHGALSRPATPPPIDEATRQAISAAQAARQPSLGESAVWSAIKGVGSELAANPVTTAAGTGMGLYQLAGLSPATGSKDPMHLHKGLQEIRGKLPDSGGAASKKFVDQVLNKPGLADRYLADPGHKGPQVERTVRSALEAGVKSELPKAVREMGGAGTLRKSLLHRLSGGRVGKAQIPLGTPRSAGGLALQAGGLGLSALLERAIERRMFAPDPEALASRALGQE